MEGKQDEIEGDMFTMLSSLFPLAVVQSDCKGCYALTSWLHCHVLRCRCTVVQSDCKVGYALTSWLCYHVLRFRFPLHQELSSLDGKSVVKVRSGFVCSATDLNFESRSVMNIKKKLFETNQLLKKREIMF